MSQHTNTNTVGGNNNHNPYAGRDRGRGQGGFGGCRGRTVEEIAEIILQLLNYCLKDN